VDPRRVPDISALVEASSLSVAEGNAVPLNSLSRAEHREET
jgi:hypothetical protein